MRAVQGPENRRKERMFSNNALLRTMSALAAFGVFAVGLVELFDAPRFGLGLIVGAIALGAAI